MIEVRRINAEELPQVHHIWNIVYDERRDYSKEQKPNPLTEPAEWGWGVFEGGGLELRGRRTIPDRVFTLRPQHVTEYF
jgi:hypothetical protein